jgi:hypothetical protein
MQHELKKFKITDIRHGKGEHGDTIYAKLKEYHTGEIYAMATLSYILNIVKREGYLLVGDNHHKEKLSIVNDMEEIEKKKKKLEELKNQIKELDMELNFNT